MNDSIRVQRSGKKIEVNDAGEYIVLDVYNIGAMGNVMGLIKEFEGSMKSLSTKAEAASRESVEEIFELAHHASEECGKLAVEINRVFGDDACRKIFGDGTPGPYELADFFGQIGALIKKYGDERIEKYTEKYKKYDKKEE